MMRVTVSDRGRRSIHDYGFDLVSVDIADTCPVCGGPRGKPKSRQFCDDGQFYSVDCWENPCGHVDKYDAVIREAKGGAS